MWVHQTKKLGCFKDFHFVTNFTLCTNNKKLQTIFLLVSASRLGRRPKRLKESANEAGCPTRPPHANPSPIAPYPPNHTSLTPQQLSQMSMAELQRLLQSINGHKAPNFLPGHLFNLKTEPAGAAVSITDTSACTMTSNTDSESGYSSYGGDTPSSAKSHSPVASQVPVTLSATVKTEQQMCAMNNGHSLHPHAQYMMTAHSPSQQSQQLQQPQQQLQQQVGEQHLQHSIHLHQQQQQQHQQHLHPHQQHPALLPEHALPKTLMPPTGQKVNMMAPPLPSHVPTTTLSQQQQQQHHHQQHSQHQAQQEQLKQQQRQEEHLQHQQHQQAEPHAYPTSREPVMPEPSSYMTSPQIKTEPDAFFTMESMDMDVQPMSMTHEHTSMAYWKQAICEARQPPNKERQGLIYQVIETVTDAHKATCIYTSDKVAAGMERYQRILDANNGMVSIFINRCHCSTVVG